MGKSTQANSFVLTAIEDLDETHLESLVSDKASEDQQLEFKRQPPDRWNEAEKHELRKDVVAMANGGGGAILFGIVEDESGHASEICGVANVSYGSALTLVREVAASADGSDDVGGE